MMCSASRQSSLTRTLCDLQKRRQEEEEQQPNCCPHHHHHNLRGEPTRKTKQVNPLFVVCNKHEVTCILLSILLLLECFLIPCVSSCGPGRGGGFRKIPRHRKLTPLVLMQHVPNVSENTISASGFKEGKITRHDSRFKDLVPNYNPDIIFKDEEGTGADRLMTRRLKEKLNTLAISVMNQWPGVRLRVTEGWDEESHHAADSLHYEGRAVDITTSDRDRSKYGMLARLAAEAGFDWVYYESRYHVHCSVKSEKSDASRAGGCFDSSSQVMTPEGPVSIQDIRVGDQILSLDSEGKPVFSPVLMFLDRDPDSTRSYFTITTSSGKTITLTGSHLIYVLDDYDVNDFNGSLSRKRVQFARQVIPKQFVVVTDDVNSVTDDNPKTISIEEVISVTVESKIGAFAPLTKEGNLVVNNVLASCYANINDQWLAHLSFLPVRIYSNVVESFNHVLFSSSKDDHKREGRRKQQQQRQEESLPNGIHWYPRLLQSIANEVLPAEFMD